MIRRSTGVYHGRGQPLLDPDEAVLVLDFRIRQGIRCDFQAFLPN
jgi:hypothetical protein